MELLEQLTKYKNIKISTIDYVFVGGRFESLDKINVVFEEEFNEKVNFELPSDYKKLYYAPFGKDLIVDDYMSTYVEKEGHLFEITLFYIKDKAKNFYITETFVEQID